MILLLTGSILCMQMRHSPSLLPPSSPSASAGNETMSHDTLMDCLEGDNVAAIPPRAGKRGPAPSSSSVGNVPPMLARKVCMALQEDILSLKDDAEKGFLPEFTSFSINEESNLDFIIHKIRKVRTASILMLSTLKIFFNLLTLTNCLFILLEQECPNLCNKDNGSEIVHRILRGISSQSLENDE